MKKTFLLVTMIMSGIVITSAQVSFGIKAGLNVSSIVNITPSSMELFGEYNSSKMKMGGQFGGYVNIPFNKTISIQSELFFSMKGYSYSYLGDEPSPVGNYVKYSDSKLTLNYIEIPLQLRINPVKCLFILAGPYVGILAEASNKTTIIYNNGSSTYSSYSLPENTQTYKSYVWTRGSNLRFLDWGLTAGLGFKAKNGFTTGFKYSRGFSSIYLIDAEREDKNANSVFQFFIGYEFAKKNNAENDTKSAIH